MDVVYRSVRCLTFISRTCVRENAENGLVPQHFLQKFTQNSISMCKTFLPIFGDNFLPRSSRISFSDLVLKKISGPAWLDVVWEKNDVILYSGRISSTSSTQRFAVDNTWASSTTNGCYWWWVSLSAFLLFQWSPLLQPFIHKLPCQVPRVLNVVDCPPHNIVHDILHYPNYYDPLYYPECYPELFATPSSVKLWLETSLTSHSSFCSSMHLSGVKFSVQWRDPYYLICSYVNGKLKQCTLSLEDL